MLNPSNFMTDPILYACLEDLRDRMLILRSDAGVKIVEETIQELKRLNAELELKNKINNDQNRFWQTAPKPQRSLEYGDHEY